MVRSHGSHEREDTSFSVFDTSQRRLNRPLQVVACPVKYQWVIYRQRLESEAKRGEQDGKDSTPINGCDAESEISDGTNYREPVGG